MQVNLWWCPNRDGSNVSADATLPLLTLPACLHLLLHVLHSYSAGYTRSSRLGLWGRSAGGLTLGASINMNPGVAAAAAACFK
jgi:hypothetical protein